VNWSVNMQLQIIWKLRVHTITTKEYIQEYECNLTVKR
jgi:hypothetical protein